MSRAVDDVQFSRLFQTVAAALRVELDTLSVPVTVVERGQAPDSGDYVILDLVRTNGGLRRIGGLGGTSWRATARPVGRAANVQTVLERCAVALEERSVTIPATPPEPARESSAFVFDGQSPIDQDDEDLALFTGAVTYVFTF